MYVGMHIHLVPNRGSPPTVLLRESYREGFIRGYRSGYRSVASRETLRAVRNY